MGAMRDNKTVTDLGLCGNCIPEDVVRAVEERLQENRCRHAASELALSSVEKDIARRPSTAEKRQRDHATSTAARNVDVGIISSTPEQLTSRRQEKIVKTPRGDSSSKDVQQSEMSPLIEATSGASNEIWRLEEDNRASNVRGDHKGSAEARDDKANEMDGKLASLGEMLRERSAAIDLLTDKLATKATEVDDTRAQLSLLQTEIDRLRDEKERFHSDRAEEVARLQKKHDETRDNWKQSYTELKNNYNECSRNKKEADFKVKLEIEGIRIF